MTTELLLRDADAIVTMDEHVGILQGASLHCVDGVVERIYEPGEAPPSCRAVVDARRLVILPGLVNTHHHLFQSLTRCLPEAQSAPLDSWHRAHYPFWAHLTAESVYAAARLTMAELLLSGCTTVVDHMTSFPNDVTVEPVVTAARELGMRLVVARGGRSSSGSHTGGQAPEALAQSDDELLQGCLDAIDEHHKPGPHSLTQVAVGPSHPQSVSDDLGRALGDLARDRDVGLHTHMHETAQEIDRSVGLTGARPLRRAEVLGWLGSKSWFAHGVHFNSEEMHLLAREQCAISHCPTSNMRLGSGVADVPALRAAGVHVGLGSDGGASNDSSNMLGEVRMGLLLQRAVRGAAAMTPEDALAIATRGGAAAIGRNELGGLAPGMAADLIGIRTDRPELAGTDGDVVAALSLCALHSVDLTVVNGEVLVADGALRRLDWREEARSVRAHAARMRQLGRG